MRFDNYITGAPLFWARSETYKKDEFVAKLNLSPRGLYMDYYLHTQCWDYFTPATVHAQLFYQHAYERSLVQIL